MITFLLFNKRMKMLQEVYRESTSNHQMISKLHTLQTPTENSHGMCFQTEGNIKELVKVLN